MPKSKAAHDSHIPPHRNARSNSNSRVTAQGPAGVWSLQLYVTATLVLTSRHLADDLLTGERAGIPGLLRGSALGAPPASPPPAPPPSFLFPSSIPQSSAYLGNSPDPPEQGKASPATPAVGCPSQSAHAPPPGTQQAHCPGFGVTPARQPGCFLGPRYTLSY